MAQSVQEQAVDITRDRTEDVFVVERPWGRFQQLTSDEPVTVKVITIRPGCRLSLQTHGHRAEMWQVLDGAADVQVDDRAWTARTGDMVWVPPGAVHRIGNSTRSVTRVLELAFGPFDEADITRLQDDYARCEDHDGGDAELAAEGAERGDGAHATHP